MRVGFGSMEQDMVGVRGDQIGRAVGVDVVERGF